MKFVYILMYMVVQNVFASSILMIGDSQMVGPMGYKLHQLLANKSNHTIVQYAHSSSAPIHWMNSTSYKLTGGILHMYSTFKDNERVTLNHPNPPHWKTPYLLNKFNDVLSNRLIHDSWNEYPMGRPFDTIVVSLSGNDLRAMYNSNGPVISQIKKRMNILNSMLGVIDYLNLDCYWVLSPRGSKKNDEHLNLLYEQYTKQLSHSGCKVYDSRKYNANMCDGVHFSCSKGRETARAWAQDIYEFTGL